jgi:putative DNA primase/helicase
MDNHLALEITQNYFSALIKFLTLMIGATHYYRRWLILVFDKVFDDDTKDTELIHKLTTQEELSGLLNLALVALRKLRIDGGFRDISVERIRQRYEENANTIKAFLDQECVIDLSAPEYSTLTTDVYAKYVIFCNQRNERPLEMNVFGKGLTEFGIEKTRSRYSGEREYYYMGIKLCSDLRGQNQQLC